MNQGKLEGYEFPEKIRVIGGGKIKKVFVKGEPYMSWEYGDEVAERTAIVQLYGLGLGTQEELAKAFEIHINSVAKYVSIFRAEGAGGLISQPRGPRQSWKLLPDVRAKILVTVLKEGIREYAAVQKRLEGYWNKKVSIGSIRQVLVEDGLVKEGTDIPKIEQGNLFESNDNSEQLEIGFPGNTDDRFIPREDGNLISSNLSPKTKFRSSFSQSQRIYLDQLEQGGYSAYAGGLLFCPLLSQYNFLPVIKRVIEVQRHEGYNLTELCLTLFYFNLFGFESIEHFKTVYPEEFGILIGKSSSPSIRTLRRFLHSVRVLGKSEALIDEFAKEYLKSGLTKWGALYIDGHFLPYYGVYPISMGWHGVRKIPMKGSYNFLTVDEKFTTLLFLIRASSEDLLQKIPEIILKVKKLAADVGISEEEIEYLTVIFDREGYSAELFRMLDGKDSQNGKFKARFISWAKYSDRWVNDIEDAKFDRTVAVTYEIQEPEEIKYFETEKVMNKYGKIRAIVIESESDKKRAAIYTNDGKMEAGRIIQLICRRWGQENLIKGLMMKHFIDYSPGYEPEEIEEQPMVDNPEVKELKQKRANLKNDLSQIKSRFGHEVLEEMEKEANWDEIKKKRVLTMSEIESIRSQITLFSQEIDKLPEKVRFDEAHGKKLLELNYEKKRFLDCIKVFTYNMEKQMCKLLLNYYDIKKEIYPALSMIVKRGGDVKLEQGRLRVRLRRFKNPEIDHAARRLCEDLNQMKPFTLDKFRFPIRYEVS